MSIAPEPQLPRGRQPKGERIATVVRFPKSVLDGLDRRGKADGLASRNDVIVEACAAHGLFPDGNRPKIIPARPKATRKKSTGGRVKTAKSRSQSELLTELVLAVRNLESAHREMLAGRKKSVPKSVASKKAAE